MKKPTIFISHIHEDAQIARCLKDFIDDAFLGSFHIFVSSDGASIRAGDNWSSSIELALGEAAVVLAVVTALAKDRRWIYFECGGAYFGRKRVIPICCKGFRIADLSPPLSWLHSIDGSTEEGAGALLAAIASAFDLRDPRSNTAQLADCLSGRHPTPHDPAETVRPAQRALPLFLLVDTSGSMAGDPIARLSDAIRKLLDDLLQFQSSSVTPLVSLLSFGSETHEVVPLSPITPATLEFKLEAAGGTALGSAFHALAAQLADMSQLPPRSIRPFIIIFTDGVPTDDWRSGLAALNNTRLGKAARKVCVAIGDSADRDILQAIAGDSVISVQDFSNIAALSSLFRWTSDSVRRLSAEDAGDEHVSMPDLPPYPAQTAGDGWQTS